MKDIQTLLAHAAVKDADKVVIASGEPLAITTGQETKQLGSAVPTQQIGNMLKASLPDDIIKQFGWGKELSHQLQINDVLHQIIIKLKEDKNIFVEIARLATTTSAEVNPQNAPPQTPAPAQELAKTSSESGKNTASEKNSELEISPELIDELTSGDTLLYYSGGSTTKEIEEILTQMEYKPKATDNYNAANQALNYHEYKLVVFILDSNFRSDPLLKAYADKEMLQRRKQFSVLIAPEIKTSDAFLSYTLSLNTVVDTADAATLLKTTIETEYANWARFVSVFHEMLAKHGKS